MHEAERLIAEWRSVAAQEAFSSASRVQARLFDLYGEVRDLPAGRVVETWLTLTVQRDLFSGAELLDLLDQLEQLLGDPVTTAP